MKGLMKGSGDNKKISDWVYLGPFLAYLSIGLLINNLPLIANESAIYVSYILRTLIVGILLFHFRGSYPELSRKNWQVDRTSLAFGLSIFIIWIVLEGRYPLIAQAESHYDPQGFKQPISTVLVLARLMGSVLVAPLIEELFMRSFLLRYIIKNDWKSLPLGSYSFESFAIVTLVFGFSHYRWLQGLLAGALFNILIYRTKNLPSTIVAHGTANLLLLAYVIVFGGWTYY